VRFHPSWCWTCEAIYRKVGTRTFGQVPEVSTRRLGLGVIGLGRAFMLMLPTLAQHPRVRLMGAADPRPEAREQFERDFAGKGYSDIGALVADPSVEAVYIASPHQFHVQHVNIAASHGKHVLVEKPMALTLGECESMIAAARNAGMYMIIGHSHSFDAPYLRARELIDSGEFGRVHMITAMNFTDYLYRPRRPEELDTAQGGGAVFSQAPHQVEIVRLLGGGAARSIRANTGAWDRARPTEGAYSAHLTFADGCFAAMTYSGYGHFDTDEFAGWVGEMGQLRTESEYGSGRRLLRTVITPEEESALKNKRAYGLAASSAEPKAKAAALAHNHFGLVVASCERADLRPTPHGVMIYADDRKWLEPLPAPRVPRAEVIDELFAAVVERRAPLHSGEWGMATVEVCLALLKSAREDREISLEHQIALGPPSASRPSAGSAPLS
jgi:phthalate 4,5-cis-dihydrodiol dehydrogenase